ncbi:DUF3224 domain-containing protein [Herbaspirillum lusitanum]|uniref:DUF3224 domain-containing protein n=1 Tax=Herbaspirillum lusitanum TaxID=213312 RepID=UPI0003075B93|nr:DUF3224 domain-containing protein [Herbaspirillum lusitanum]
MQSSSQASGQFFVSGDFTVTIGPPSAVVSATSGPAIGRHVLVKQYHGPLQGDSQGEMLTAGRPAEGEASYVAIESVQGTLDGRTGGFALAHFGQMHAGGETLSVNVVPGSGTGELSGLMGELKIQRESGKHRYAFTYWFS